MLRSAKSSTMGVIMTCSKSLLLLHSRSSCDALTSLTVRPIALLTRQKPFHSGATSHTIETLTLQESDSRDADSCIQHLPVGREARTYTGGKGMDTLSAVQGTVAMCAIMRGACGSAVATSLCMRDHSKLPPSTRQEAKPSRPATFPARSSNE